MKYATSTDSDAPRRRTRTTRTTWAKPGQSDRYSFSASVVRIDRRSTHPCPKFTVAADASSASRRDLGWGERSAPSANMASRSTARVSRLSLTART